MLKLFTIREAPEHIESRNPSALSDIKVKLLTAKHQPGIKIYSQKQQRSNDDARPHIKQKLQSLIPCQFRNHKPARRRPDDTYKNNRKQRRTPKHRADKNQNHGPRRRQLFSSQLPLRKSFNLSYRHHIFKSSASSHYTLL